MFARGLRQAQPERDSDQSPHPLSLSLSKAARWFGLIAFSLLAGASQAHAPLQLPEIDHIVVRKESRTMELWSYGRLAHVIEGIQLGDQPAGPKRFQGDERTPEGRFTIDYGNPESAYNLSLHITYPRAEDRAFAEAQGRSPGGLIFIHGQPNALPAGRIPGDWTDGCIAVSNEEIVALYEAVPDGAVIDILP